MRGNPMNALAKVLVLLAITSTTALSQQTKTSPKHVTAGGMLSGRVFGVTKGGDFKPAILADVYLFYEFSIRSDGKVADMNESGTAGNLYMDSLVKEKATNVGKMEQQGWSDRLECLNAILAYQSTIVTTLQGVTKDKSWQVVTGQTDENGYFSLRVPRQGAYILVAKGQVGANDAAWEQDEVRIFTGKTTELKVGSPAESCLQTRDN
jgi:hypothetical protein